jgi:squalene-hopene/tetraprenyl-beta-curcumene cyclase
VNVAPGTEPGGWFFEYANAWYPDVDDTAMVAMSLRRIGGPANIAAAERGVRWILSMQNDDGGWAAFDKTKDRPIYEFVPFADHNAIQDPSCPDITGRVLECLSWHGLSLDHPAIRRAVQYIETKQEREGCFFGRWGVNYIYGTWQALRGLAAIGTNMEEEWIRRGRDWLESCQNDDGGWGETCESYNFPALKGRGPSTASQTAWALMGLCACGDASRESIASGVEWLVTNQNPDGSWTEDYTTGTGFPGVFYLKYDMYRNHFPLLALATYTRMVPPL